MWYFFFNLGMSLWSLLLAEVGDQVFKMKAFLENIEVFQVYIRREVLLQYGLNQIAIFPKILG